MSFRKKSGFFITLILCLTMVFMSACSNSSKANGSANNSNNGKSGSSSTIKDPLKAAYAGKFKGQTVKIFGPFTGKDATHFNDSIKGFEQKTGIQIQYQGSNQFTNTINVRMQGGNPPDIADFAQPGLLRKFVKEGKVIDLSQFLSDSYLKKQYGQSWLSLSKMQGPNGTITAGVFQRVNAKSFVWYNTKAFKEAGFQIPKTWDQLMALTKKIANEGYAPWSIGINAGGATGWYGTDWLEEIMLRTTSLDNYKKWIKGDLKFTSPEVKNAMSIMDKIWKNDNYVYGGTKAIANTKVSDMPQPIFSNPPKAFMELQGNFVTNSIPKSVAPGGYSFFVLPPINQKYGAPLEVGGDMMAMLKDSPVVRAVMEYFTKGQSLEGWIKAGGCISPHKDSKLSWYPNDTSRKVAKAILNAKKVAFDASDSMPSAVGTGSFWKAMTDYVSTNKTDEQILKEAQSGFNQ